MAAVRFYTRSTGNKPVPVYVSLRDKDHFWIRVVTPYSILPKYWSNKKQALKPNVDYPSEADKIAVETKVKEWNELSIFIVAEYKKLKVNPTSEWVKSTIDKFNKRIAPSTETLTEYIKRFVTEAKSGKRLTSESKKYTHGTCRVLTGFMQSFEKFCEEKKRQYDFNDIDQDFYNAFVQFFYDRKCSGNYVGRRIANLKTIMRSSMEEGLHKNLATKTRAFKVIKSEVDSIYLTADEIQALLTLDLSDNKVYDIARDVFLIGCYTAQRYSDYSKISKSNIKVIGGVKYIELIQQKTGEKCIIPISPDCNKILQKYNYNLPKTFEQKINFNIKKVAEKAGIKEVIYYEQNIGGLTVKKKAFKYELCRTHTARRSGCTLMYLAGVPTIDAMKISGHRSEMEYLHYIKVTKQETAINLSKHPYFNLKVV